MKTDALSNIYRLHKIIYWLFRGGNTSPMDNAPGGQASTEQFNINMNTLRGGFGVPGTKISLNFERFCFIPTISSLNINTNNLLYNVNANSTSTTLSFGGNNYTFYTPSSSFTSFKSFSAPSTTSAGNNYWNEPHAIPTIHSGSIVGWVLLSDAFSRRIELDAISNTINGINVNFGYKTPSNPTSSRLSTGGNLYNNLSIINGGKLLINGHEQIVFPWSVTDYPDANSAFHVSTSASGCDEEGIVIDVNNTGEVVLGSSTDTRTGVLHVIDHSQIIFRSGSKLTAHNNSSIIIGKGSIMRIESNVDIDLNDNECTIEILDGGTLEVVSGATFTFSGNGKLKLHATATNNAVLTGSGQALLIGNGKSDVIVEFIPKGSVRNVIIANTVQNLEINDGKITGDCNLQVNAPIQLDNVDVRTGGAYTYDFNANSYVLNTDIYPRVRVFDDAEFVGSNFVNSNLEAYNITSGSDQFTINQCLFNGVGEEAIYIYNCNTDIRNLTVIDRPVGLRAEAMTYPVTCDNCNVSQTPNQNNSTHGIIYSGTSTSPLTLISADIIEMDQIGVEMEESELIPQCSRIKKTSGSGASILLLTDASLTMDPSIHTGAGRNDLSGFATTISCDDADNVQINNAQTNLNCTGDALSGNITTSYNNVAFNAEGNYWKWGGAPSFLNHYYWFYEGNSQRFNSSGYVFNGANYLTTAPDIDYLCGTDEEEPGGGDQGKSHTIKDIQFAKISEHIPFSSNQTFKDAVLQVLNPGFELMDWKQRFAIQEKIITTDFNQYNEMVKPAQGVIYQNLLTMVGTAAGNQSINPKTHLDVFDQLLSIQNQLLSKLI